MFQNMTKHDFSIEHANSGWKLEDWNEAAGAYHDGVVKETWFLHLRNLNALVFLGGALVSLGGALKGSLVILNNFQVKNGLRGSYTFGDFPLDFWCLNNDMT